MPVSLDASLAVPDDVIFRELDGEAIILNLAKGIYFGLDDVGTRAWMLLSEIGRVDRVVDMMAAEYDVEPATLTRDLLALVSELLDKGLLQVAPPGEPPA